jgi:hypothetical protein
MCTIYIFYMNLLNSYRKSITKQLAIFKGMSFSFFPYSRNEASVNEF